MNDDHTILIAISTTLLVGVVNVFTHIMPYSAPPVLMVIFIGLSEIYRSLRAESSRSS